MAILKPAETGKFVSPEYRKQCLEMALRFYDGAEVVSAEEVVATAQAFHAYIHERE